MRMRAGPGWKPPWSPTKSSPPRHHDDVDRAIALLDARHADRERGGVEPDDVGGALHPGVDRDDAVELVGAGIDRQVQS
jgi:hypothetical protein